MARIGSDDDIMYVYQADLLCKECGDKVRAELTAKGQAPENPDDECTYESDDFPKVALISQSETDSPNHCAGCEVYLAQPLTGDGVEYVVERMEAYVTACYRGRVEILDEWAQDLSDSGYCLETEDQVVLDLYLRRRANETGC